MKSFTRILGIVILAQLFFSGLLRSQQPNVRTQRVVLERITVINVLAETEATARSSDRDVWIEGNRVVRIVAAGSDDAGPDARRMDCSNKYLVPGFWDMHAHVHWPKEETECVVLPMLFANGITGIRDMNSDNAPPARTLEELRQLQRQIDQGELIGPRLLALCRRVNGAQEANFVERHSSLPLTAEHGKVAAQAASLRGIDFIKVYSDLPRDAFLGLMHEANRLQLPVSGHLPFAVDPREASELGMGCIEHAHFPALASGAEYEPWRQVYADYVAKKVNARRPSLARLQREICASFKEELCREIVQTLAKNNTYLCPTHTTRRLDALADDPKYVADPRRKFIPANRLSFWDRDLSGAAGMAAEFRQGFRDFYELSLRATGLAHQHGVRILVGTDCLDTQVFPGFSYHDEMEHLHQAGLSNLAILQAATIHSAEFLKQDEKYGSISPGKVADMIVLGSDPLVEIGNVRNIESIVFDGRVFNRDELRAMLDAVILFASQTPVQEALWNAVIRGDVNKALAAVKEGADLNELDTRNNSNGRRALNYAAERNEAEMIRALVEAGAQVDLANKTGYTALHHAAETGSNEAAKVLLQLGADTSRKTSRGQTPRQIAESRGMAGVVKILQASQ